MAQAEVPYPFVGLASSGETIVVASSSTVHAINPSAASSSNNKYTLPSSSNASTFIRQLAISSDSRHAATLSDDKGLRIYTLSSDSITLDSTRYLTKKASDLSFVPESNDVLVSDKVGDCYLYPLIAREIDTKAEKLKKLDVQADPTLNPECTYLLGHVSVLTNHIFTEDRKHIITADRDEHIRITRYPDTFVIDRYLFGTDGFVSSIHVPLDHPDLLLSGGGEGILRLWNWREGKQIGTVDIGDSILPHRAVRSTLRKDKRRIKGSKRTEDPFYAIPEGWMLPSGQGICIKRISSLRIGGSVVVLFFSEGASAIHSFIFSADPSSAATKITTIPTPFPVLEYALLPGTSDQVLVSLDTTFNIVAFNQEAGQKPKKDVLVTEEQAQKAKKQFMVLQVGSDASITDITSSSSLVSDLEKLATYPESSSSALSQLNLYPNLSLYPRWPGLEEDDDLAGPAVDPTQVQGGADANVDPTSSTSSPAPTPAPAPAPAHASAALSSLGKNRREYTKAEYEAMNIKFLGRLKSQGYDVESYMRIKRRETKDRRLAAKRRRVDAGLSELSKEEEAEQEEEEMVEEAEQADLVEEDEEEGGNA